MNKFQRSLELFRRSLQVIGDNKKLLVFPFVSAGLFGVIVLFFLVPVAVLATGYRLVEVVHLSSLANRSAAIPHPGGSIFYLLLGGAYLLAMFTSTFSNVAFYNEILNALNDRPVSVRGGLKIAASRWKAILLWSLLAGVIGLIIRSVERRVGLIGRLVVGLIGVGWSVASIFVIPSIVREESGANPLRLLKSSAALLKKTWGESLIGYIGISFGGLTIFLGSVIFLGINFGMNRLFDSGAVVIVGCVIWFVCLIVFSDILLVAGEVYRGALFIFATEGVTPGPFDPEQMNMAWKIKAGRKPTAPPAGMAT